MEIAKKSSGVTFQIVLDDNVAKPEPRRVVQMKNRHNKKKLLTAGEIEKRQKQAEQRRQARVEARLKRMHEREESTRKLACTVDILLQQQALRNGKIPNPNVAVMCRQEILKTANDVVKGFNEMQRQLLNVDLKVDERKCQVGKMPESKLQKGLKSSKNSKNLQRGMSNSPKQSPIPEKKPVISSDQKAKGIAFEIPVDDFGSSRQCSRKPSIANLQKKCCTAESQELVAKKLDDKMRKAEERRQKKQENKVRKTRESRESLMELRRKVDMFRRHQAALEN